MRRINIEPIETQLRNQSMTVTGVQQWMIGWMVEHLLLVLYMSSQNKHCSVIVLDQPYCEEMDVLFWQSILSSVPLREIEVQ